MPGLEDGAVGVLGAGTMGAGIAQVAVEAGHPVRIFDADPASSTRAMARIEDGLGRRARRSHPDEATRGEYVATLLARVRVVETLAELTRGAGLVIEAIVEDIESNTIEPAIVERVTLAIIAEAYRALEDGVAPGHDIDVAMRLGASHPRGPLEAVQQLGGPEGVLAGLERYVSAGPRFSVPTLLTQEVQRTRL